MIIKIFRLFKINKIQKNCKLMMNFQTEVNQKIQSLIKNFFLPEND